MDKKINIIPTPYIHPKHHKFAVLLTAVIIVFAYIIIMQLTYVDKNAKVAPKAVSDPSIVTTQQRADALAELKSVMAKSPPVTDKERAKALQDLKKVVANQK